MKNKHKHTCTHTHKTKSITFTNPGYELIKECVKNHVCFGFPSFEILKDLLLDNVNINIIDNYNVSALMHLCMNPHVTTEMLDLFFKNKYNLINLVDNHGDNAFTYLCRNRYVTFEMIQLFINNGTTFNIKNVHLNEYNYLSALCMNKNITLEILQLCIKKTHDKKILKNYSRAFIYLCKNKKISIHMLKLFLKNSINLNFENKHNRTCLQELCKNPNVTKDQIILLINSGAKINENVMYHLCYNPNLRLELIEIFINLGIKIKHKSLVLNIILDNTNSNDVKLELIHHLKKCLNIEMEIKTIENYISKSYINYEKIEDIFINELIYIDSNCKSASKLDL